jgi:predicted TIM-barrel fold metal-dependent hydrolase
VAHRRLGDEPDGPHDLPDLQRHLRAAADAPRDAARGGVAWLPGLLWRLDTNWRGLRAEVPWLERKPSEIMRDHIRFSTQPLEHTDGNDPLLFEMLAAAGAPEILCFASDYPHWDWDDPRFVLRRLPDEWRQKVMHDNAVEHYGARLGYVAPRTVAP